MIFRESDLSRVIINASWTVEEAVSHADGAGAHWLSVFESDRFVGVVDYAQLLTMEPSGFVKDADFVSVPCRNLSELRHNFIEAIRETESGVVAVFESGTFRGILLAEAWLDEFKILVDDLTGLPWSGYLRTWTADQLTEGREVCVLLLEVPEMSKINRVRGFDAGDQLLRKVADYLKETLDPNTDILARFSGDEFLIATVRPRASAEALAQRAVLNLTRRLTECQREAALPSITVVGGRRTQPRSTDSIMATVDNLLRLARKAALGGSAKS